MEASPLVSAGVSRRAFLAACIAWRLTAGQGKGRVLEADRVRYPDPATEFEVVRLTDPSYTSLLPAYYGRPLARDGGFLLYSSDRDGNMQAFRLDLRTGESRQLTEAEDLDPLSVTLLPGERSFCFFDGRWLRQASLASLREREVYSTPNGFERGEGFSVSEDGVHASLVERGGRTFRLRLIAMARGAAATVVEAPEPLSHPMPRPRRAGILYRRGADALWLVNYDGRQNRRLRLAPGGLGPALWAPDGKTVCYLNYPEARGALNALREFTPDTNGDQLIAPTSQFVHFNRNADAKVFVGASANKASPYVLILLRVSRRELTLCEHRASDPRMVAPIFSSSSQRVFFQSDRHGKPAIYSMAVDRLVEKTEP